MRSPFTGLVCTLLIFAPLVAVPCLAIFGVPHSGPSSAAAQTDDLKFAADREPQAAAQNGDLLAPVQISDSSANADASASAPDATNPSGPTERERDPFAQFNRSREEDGTDPSVGRPLRLRRSRPNGSVASHNEHGPVDEGNGLAEKSLVALGAAGQRQGETVEDRSTLDNSEDNPSDRSRSKGGATMTGQRQSSADETITVEARQDPRDAVSDRTSRARHRPGEPLNWRSAVARLNALGIHDYELQPGEREGDFHFSCRLVSRANPRVMMRFEAEAPDPLDAVAKVLAQIDDWKRHHSAGTSTWLQRPSQPMLTARGPSDDGTSARASDGNDR
jgi:hypothetical protein